MTLDPTTWPWWIWVILALIALVVIWLFIRMLDQPEAPTP
jgi:hypothetical protein